MKYLNSTAEVEELVQGLFVYIWEKREQLTINTSMKSYLYMAIRNRCFNYIKHEKVKQNYVQAQQAQEMPLVDGEAQWNYEELETRVKEVIEGLPARCREIYLLSREEGLRYREIAERLGISIKTVETQMGRALKVLRRELKDYLPLWVLVFLW